VRGRVHRLPQRGVRVHRQRSLQLRRVRHGVPERNVLQRRQVQLTAERPLRIRL
jgi:hypothetical protein